MMSDYSSGMSRETKQKEASCQQLEFVRKLLERQDQKVLYHCYLGGFTCGVKAITRPPLRTQSIGPTRVYDVSVETLNYVEYSGIYHPSEMNPLR